MYMCARLPPIFPQLPNNKQMPSFLYKSGFAATVLVSFWQERSVK